MMGLSVLYAKGAVKEREWGAIPDRDKTGRLREVYWARRAESKISAKSFIRFNLYWRPDRYSIARRSDDPGDGFIYLADMMEQSEGQFEWLEVTEVFTTVPASQIEGAMRSWNGISARNPVDLDEFRKELPLGRPSKTEQRKAADQVIAQVERKLAKSSYGELLEKYGYGTLVVGLPLWFAVPPDNPCRAENAVDNFFTRTMLGLQDVKRRTLKRRDCPFKSIIVLWDTTPQAIRAWIENRSMEYEHTRSASMEDPLDASILELLPDMMEKALSKTAIPESDAPSISFHIIVKTRKRKLGKGPLPEFVEAMQEFFRERGENRLLSQMREKVKWRVISGVCKLYCFLNLRGLEGLSQWIAPKISVSHAWKVRTTRRRAQLFYSESKRRPRALNARSSGSPP